MRTFLTRLWNARRAIVLYASLLLSGWLLGETLLDVAIPTMRPMNEPMIHRIVMIALVAYIITAAIPFVPGAEIGFALLLLFGGKAAPLVYTGMVLALVTTYLIARILPSPILSGFLNWLGLEKASLYVSELSAASHDERLRLFTGLMPSSVGKKLLSNRYLVLAVALNVPGNSLLGGGGGLAFMAGTSGLFAFWPYLAVVMLAVAPIPLIFFFA